MLNKNQFIPCRKLQVYEPPFFFTTLEGKLINGWVYENGKVVKRISEPVESRGKSKLNPMGLEDLGDYGGPSDCHYEYVDYYERYCYYNTGTGEITSCTAWQYEYTETYMFCEGGGGSGGGGGGYIEYDEPEPPAQPDPCATAQAQQATSFATTSNFINAKNQIENAAGDGKEHGISFGKGNNGNIIVSEMTTGSESGGTLNPIQNQFADLHNHPDNLPPSSGDVYQFIDRAKNHSEYQTKYVILSNGTVYALVITDITKASQFVSNYPIEQVGNLPPDFPDPVFSDFDDAKTSLEYNGLAHGDAEANALAWVLEKYAMGIALLKMDNDGKLNKLGTVESEENGTITYTVNNCQ